MAEKTSKVFVRLTRDFPVGAQHRRGGVTLNAGPQPVEAEVTGDQLDQLKADRYVEIVDKKEAQKWQDRLKEDPRSTSADIVDDGVGAPDQSNGRTYEGNDGNGKDGSDEGKLPEVTTDMKVKELIKVADDEGVEGTETFSNPGTTKQSIIDAIEAHRSTSEE